MNLALIDTGRINMRYELSGPTDAPVVCLNHCFASDLNYWDPHLSSFDGFRVLRYDTRGHGGSDAPPGPYTLEMLADDVVALLDVLSIETVHFCGVSLGGQIAQTFALNYPHRLASLTLVNSTCEYTQVQAQSWRDRAQIAMTQGMPALEEQLLLRWFTDSAAQQNIAGFEYMRGAIGRFSANSFAAASEAMCMLDTTARLGAIKVPALVVATPDDPGAPREISEKMARLIPNCALEWLEPARHLSSLEHPQRFNAIMRNFLSPFAC